MPTSAQSKQNMSLRRKMTLWTVAITAPMYVVATFSLLSLNNSAIERYFNTRLEARRDIVADGLVHAEEPIDDALMSQLIEKVPRVGLDERFMLVLYSPASEVIASSIRPAPPAERFAIHDVLASGTADTRRVPAPELEVEPNQRLIGRAALRSIRYRGGGIAVLAVVGDDRDWSVMSANTSWLFFTMPLVGALATGLSAWLIAGLVVRPIRDLRAVAQSLEPAHLHEPVAESRYSSEIAEVRQQIDQTRDKLQAAFRSQERFMLNIGHELKTPIAVVLTEVETLGTDPTPDEIHAFARSVKEEMRRLSAVVDAFSTLALVQSGRPLAHPRTYLLNEFVLEAIHTCESDARARHATLAPVLADAQASAVVYGDPQLLRVMVESLIRNAARYTPDGESVHVEVTTNDGTGLISVRDAGPALPPEILEHVFDRFTQPPRSSGRARNVGMGVSIAKGIAEMHGGDITAKNLPDCGCVFTISLPLVQVRATESSTTR